MTENAFDRISEAFYSLTAAEKKTADFIMHNPERSQVISIGELAESSGVAEATVSRFCRRLGYKNFNAFRLALASASATQTPDSSLLSGPVQIGDSIEEMSQKLYSADQTAMHQTLELIDPDVICRAADMMTAAGRVVCMGQGGSMYIAFSAANLFSTVSGKFSAVEGSHNQVMTAVNLDPGDVILFYSYSGATKDMIDTMNIAKPRGVKLLLVTRFAKSPGAALADVVLLCGSNESPLQLGSVPAKIAQLFLTDVLFSEFCRRDMKACLKTRERIAEAMMPKHL